MTGTSSTGLGKVENNIKILMKLHTVSTTK